MFAEDVAARADFWIVGDEAVRASISTRQAMKSECGFDNKLLPYIYEYYNVNCYFESPLGKTKSVAARILNSVIQGMNAWAHLPRYILVIPDVDILNYACKYDYLMNDTEVDFEEIMSWLVRQIKRSIKIRLDDLHRKHPGAILKSVEPRII